MSEPTSLWAQYKSTGERQDRDALIEHYMPLLEDETDRVAPNLPVHLDRSELINSGFFGLVDAIEKFDTSRGLKFTTYACARIRGAILDSLRVHDWAPRSLRVQAREARRTEEALEQRLKRQPTDAELAGEVGIDQAELAITRLSTSVVSLDSVSFGGSSDERTSLNRLVDQGDEPGDSYVLAELRDRLADVIAALSEREQVLLGLYYGEGLTFAAISKQLGIGETRTSQIHAAIMHSLRSALSGTMLVAL